MSKENHGLVGGLIKIIMVVVFFLIGAATLTMGIVGLVKKWNPDANWINIVNIVLGACLLTSPFFMNRKREGLNVVIKVLMVIIFVAIGALFITAGAIALAKDWYPDYKWYPIVNIVFGGLLLTSPYFLKKDL